MKAKLIGILVVTLLIATVWPVMATNLDIETKGYVVSINNDGALDQSQTSHAFMHSLTKDTIYAQTFKPSLGSNKECMLSRVEVKLSNHPQSYGGPLFAYIGYDIEGPWRPLRVKQMVQLDCSNWVEIDFDDLPVIPEESYYIALEGYGNSNNFYGWLCTYNYYYTRGNGWIGNEFGENWHINGMDFCFKTYRTSHPSEPELSVSENSFDLGEIKKGNTESFKVDVKNVGEANSKLFWEVKDKPSWVSSISPWSYGELKAGEEINLQVQVSTADLSESSYSESILLTAGEYGGGDETISISFTVPAKSKIKSVPHVFPFLQKLTDHFPLLAKILQLPIFNKLFDQK